MKLVNDNSKTNYSVGSESIDNTKVLKSNLCHYKDGYILARGNITLIGHQVTHLAFKNVYHLLKVLRELMKQ